MNLDFEIHGYNLRLNYTIFRMFTFFAQRLA